MAGGAIEAAISRHPPIIRSITLWTAICVLLVLVAHVVIARTSFHPDSYRSGTLTLIGFVLATLYSVRKRSLRTSVRLLRDTAKLPISMAARVVSLDRLEMWRFVHVAIGILVLLP